MDTAAKHGGDDLDLDALMVRVRDAAMAGAGNGDASRRDTASDATGAEIDLVRLIDAQGEWNEHTRQALAALLDCLRTLRDDWMDAHARLRREVAQLSELVGELRTPTTAAARRAKPRTPARRRSKKEGRRRS
jgi:hypothetical protein